MAERDEVSRRFLVVAARRARLRESLEVEEGMGFRAVVRVGGLAFLVGGREGWADPWREEELVVGPGVPALGVPEGPRELWRRWLAGVGKDPRDWLRRRRLLASLLLSRWERGALAGVVVPPTLRDAAELWAMRSWAAFAMFGPPAPEAPTLPEMACRGPPATGVETPVALPERRDGPFQSAGNSSRTLRLRRPTSSRLIWRSSTINAFSERPHFSAWRISHLS